LQVPGAFAAAADENQMGGAMMGKASKRGALGELAGMGKKALTKVCLCPLRAPRLSRTNNCEYFARCQILDVRRRPTRAWGDS